MSDFKKCPSCFFKNAVDAEACEQCTTDLPLAALSDTVAPEAEEIIPATEAVEPDISVAGDADRPLESAMSPPDPPEVTDDELSADQAEEVSPVESSTGPPPPPEDDSVEAVESDSAAPPVPPDEEQEPVTEESAGPPPAPPDEEAVVTVSQSIPPPAPPEEEQEPVTEESAGPPPAPPDEEEPVVANDNVAPPAPPDEEPVITAPVADDGPPLVPDFADTPPAPPAGPSTQPAKSGSKLKIVTIIAVSLILLSAVGVGAFALLNRGGTEVATLSEEPSEDLISEDYDDPFNFDQNQAEFESPEHEDELLPETEPEEIPPADPSAGSGSNGTGSDTPSGQGGPTTPSGGNGSGGSILPIPIADIYIEPNNPTVDKTVIFSGAGSVSSNPNGIIRSYRWIFSDGVTGTGIAFQREFANSGLYVVELEVTDDQGKTGRAMDWVTVSAAGSGTSQTTPGGSQSSETGGTESSTGNWWEFE